MRSSLAHPSRFSPVVCLALIAALTLLLSGWTCSAFFYFNDCPDAGAKAQLTSVSPDTISRDAGSVLLTLEGSGFTSQSQVLWNGNVLDTVFIDARHLQTTISQETFDSFGGSGDSVLVSVRPHGSMMNQGCSKEGDSTAQPLKIR